MPGFKKLEVSVRTPSHHNIINDLPLSGCKIIEVGDEDAVAIRFHRIEPGLFRGLILSVEQENAA
jgi:hypothetical protein